MSILNLYLLLILSFQAKGNEDLFENAKNLLNNLNTEVNSAIEAHLPSILLLPSELIALGFSVTVPASVQIKGYVKELNNLIDNLETEAVELGNIDIDALNRCILGYEWEIISLQNSVNFEIQSCVNGTVDQGIRYIERYITEIDALANRVRLLELDVEGCKLLEDQQECILSVIDKIKLCLVDLPARISDNEEKGHDVVNAMKPNMQYCAKNRVDIVHDVGLSVVDSIRNCAAMPVSTG